MSKIQDGLGKNIFAGVTDDFRLMTQADVIPHETERSIDGFRFGFNSGILNLPVNFDGPVLWFKNTDNNRLFHISRFVVGWNGGNTTASKTIQLTNIKNSSIPTGNQSVANIGNSNFASTREALGEAVKWDGSGTSGMSGSTGGIPFVFTFIAPGRTPIILDGAVILGSESTIAINLKTEEAGLATVAILGYYQV